MVLPIAFALMAASGYKAYKQGQKREAEEEDERAWRKSEREHLLNERARMKAMRDDISSAAAPVEAVDGTVFQPANDDEGNPMPANPTEGTLKVGEQRFTDRAAAAQAAAAANAPEARTARMSAALEKHGEIGTAQSLRTGARQEQLADLELNEAKTARLNAEYDRGLVNAAQSWQGLEAFVNESKGDGQGGELKIKLVPSPDGKMVTVNRLNPDGTAVPTPFQFPADQTGLAQAAFRLSRGISAQQKLEHLLGQAKTDEERRRWEKEFGLREQGERRRAAHESRLENNSARMLSLAEQKAQREAGPAQITLEDKRKFESDVFARLKGDIDPSAADSPEERAALVQQQRELGALATGIFEANARTGQFLTAEAALQAMRLAQDPKKVTRLKGSDGNVYDTVRVNGRPVIVSEPLQPKAAAAPVPAPAPAAPAPAPVTRMSASTPAPAAPAAAPLSAKQQLEQEELRRTQAIEQLKQRLAVDDDIKSSFGGSASRAIRHRALPMGMAERRDVERELARLEQGI